MGVLFVLAAAWSAMTSAQAQSNKVRITQLSDIAFGDLSSPGDHRASESLCVFANTSNSGYAVIASGSGPSGAFVLTSGQDTLPFEVQWSGSANQTSGAGLTAGVPSLTFASNAEHQSCNNGPSASASLTVVLRAAQLDQARAGTYSGALQITIVPN